MYLTLYLHQLFPKDVIHVHYLVTLLIFSHLPGKLFLLFKFINFLWDITLDNYIHFSSQHQYDKNISKNIPSFYEIIGHLRGRSKMLCSWEPIHTTMIFFMTVTFITQYVPSKSDLPLDNTIIQYFSIMVQWYSWRKMVSQNICEMLLQGRANLQKNSHLCFCGILAVAQRYGDFSRSLFLCEILQDLICMCQRMSLFPYA